MKVFYKKIISVVLMCTVFANLPTNAVNKTFTEQYNKQHKTYINKRNNSLPIFLLSAGLYCGMAFGVYYYTQNKKLDLPEFKQFPEIYSRFTKLVQVVNSFSNPEELRTELCKCEIPQYNSIQITQDLRTLKDQSIDTRLRYLQMVCTAIAVEDYLALSNAQRYTTVPNSDTHLLSEVWMLKALLPNATKISKTLAVHYCLKVLDNFKGSNNQKNRAIAYAIVDQESKLAGINTNSLCDDLNFTAQHKLNNIPIWNLIYDKSKNCEQLYTEILEKFSENSGSNTNEYIYVLRGILKLQKSGYYNQFTTNKKSENLDLQI